MESILSEKRFLVDFNAMEIDIAEILNSKELKTANKNVLTGAKDIILRKSNTDKAYLVNRGGVQVDALFLIGAELSDCEKDDMIIPVNKNELTEDNYIDVLEDIESAANKVEYDFGDTTNHSVRRMLDEGFRAKFCNKEIAYNINQFLTVYYSVDFIVAGLKFPEKPLKIILQLEKLRINRIRFNVSTEVSEVADSIVLEPLMDITTGKVTLAHFEENPWACSVVIKSKETKNPYGPKLDSSYIYHV